MSSQVFTAHNVVCTTISFSGNHSNLWNGCLCISVQQFSTMSNNTTILLTSTRKKTWNINKSNQRNIESITESNEPGSFDTGINVQTTSGNFRLITNNTNWSSINPRKSDNNILGIIFLNLPKVLIINNLFDNILNIIW